MNMTLTQAIERKTQARRDWHTASFDEKMSALLRMQRMAQAMAQASGRRFEGTVWKEGAGSIPI